MTTTKEVVSDEKEKPAPLTAVRKKIFIKHVWGEFQKKRWLIFSFFLTLFYAVPFLRIEGRPAILFDIPARKFHLFYTTLWPQDVYLLTLVLITSAIGLFFSTAIVGRVWCGYLCPQTVYTSVFIEIERFILGDSIRQKKLAKMPMKGAKLIKLSIRNIIWAIVAFSAGFTFLSYFIPNSEIVREISTGELNGWSLFWLLFITGLAFFDFGFFREQFCFIPCPYGRFQGALQDPHSLVVTYDKAKGEGNPEKGIKPACINCNFCEIVCPTGIDIRNGAQFECISCARCIDACAIVQVKQGRSPDLIRYASENSFHGKETKIIRPRILIYTVLLLSFISFISYQLYSRKGFDFEVTRNRNLIYQQLGNGKISNIYSLKVLNMSNKDASYSLKLKDIDAEIITGSNPISVKAGGVEDVAVSLIATQAKFPAKVTKFHFLLERTDENSQKTEVEEGSTFVVP
ncbi:MAG: cytochrome c oxidase accessory protein CcoG [Candidatus Sericytochromatia bacterium]